MADRVAVKVVEKFDVYQIIKDHIKATGTDESFFIEDVGDIVRKFILWNKLMPRIDPDFAFKCNNHITVVGTLAALGAGYDCASRGEIEGVLSMGVAPDKIAFSQTVKPVSHINYAKEHNVRKMTFDNEEELIKVQKNFPEAELLLRLRFDQKSTNKIGFGEKFGCLPGAHSEFLMRRAKELGLSIRGIAFHIGIGCLDYDVYARAIRDAAAAMKYGKELGFKNMNFLDIGGGFPGRETETVTSVSKIINDSLEKYFPNKDEVEIISEPGTYFAEKAFTLAVNVHSKNVKINADGVETVHYYITDGIYQSFNMESTHGVPVVVKTLKDYSGKPTKNSIIWGRACDPHDVVLQNVQLPELECGDWLVFEDSGAYRITTSTFFNGFPSHPIYPFIEKNMLNTFKSLQVPHIKLAYDFVE